MHVTFRRAILVLSGLTLFLLIHVDVDRGFIRPYVLVEVGDFVEVINPAIAQLLTYCKRLEDSLVKAPFLGASANRNLD